MGRERNDDPYVHRNQSGQRRYEPEHEELEEYTEDDVEDGYEPPVRRRPATRPSRPPYPPQRADGSGRRVPAPRPHTDMSPPPKRTDYADERYVQRAPARASELRPVRRPAPTYTRSIDPPVRKRRFWPTFLIGCLAGLVLAVLVIAGFLFYTIRSLQPGAGRSGIPGLSSNAKAFTKQDTQTITASALAHILVCDQFGNVTMKIDPASSAATLTSQKTVYATSQATADQLLKNIAVNVQQPAAGTAPTGCSSASGSDTTTPVASASSMVTATGSGAGVGSDLAINATFPSGNAAAGTPSTIDLTITLPQGIIPPTAGVYVKSSQGDISIDGISGVLTLIGGGNIKVQHVILATGSNLATNLGKVIFNGLLSNPNNENQSQQALYIIHGEKGVDVTVPSQPNVILDVNVSSGSINSDFQIVITKRNGGASALSPLTTDTAVNAKLKLSVGLGDAFIHKAAPVTAP